MTNGDHKTILNNLIATTKYSKLRDWQKEFFDIWLKRYKEVPKFGIRVPTGTGKTLIGVAISELNRMEDKSVLYVTGTDVSCGSIFF